MEQAIQNPADFGRVAVLMGGTAAEREISLNSGRAVLQALLQLGINAFAIELGANPIADLQASDMDRVFNMVHGRGGEDGVIQGVLESMGIPYTGSGVLGSALSMDKQKTKLCWKASQLPTPAWMMMQDKNDAEQIANQLGFPLMVKPIREGSSIGMKKAETLEQLHEGWDAAVEFDEVMVEQWIEGNEYTVGILNGQPLPIIRLETPNQFYDYEAKYCVDTTQYHCPSGLSVEQETSFQQLAIKASEVVGVTGWCRVDLFTDQQQQPSLIEVNTVPGMTDHSLVPMAAKAAGIDFEALVWRILETSFSHREQRA